MANTKTNDEKVCSNPDCGKVHSIKEVERIYGKESRVAILGYCSARCYTAYLMKK